MAQTISAIYENGILKPLQTVNLKEHSRVHLTIEIEEEQEKEIDLCSRLQCVDREELGKWLDEWFRHIGVDVHPIGAEKLQEMMLKEGVHPEDNILSRGIIEMREE